MGDASRRPPVVKRTRSPNIEPTAPNFSHPFRADFNDHFETSMEALRDILVVVEQLRPLVRPSAPEQFTVYDPYYCAGKVSQRWRELGVPSVIHANRDFYKDITDDTVPTGYDMLITNPPFSANHIQRLFEFLVTSRKPFAILAPDYTATKEWYKTLVRQHFTAAVSSGKVVFPASRQISRPEPPPFPLCGNPTPAATEMGVEPFYLVPRGRYDFEHPRGAGNAHSHFRSMWFVWTGRRTAEVLRGAKVEFARVSNKRDGKGKAAPLVVHGLDALVEGHHVQSGTRQNPQRRWKQQEANRHGKSCSQ